MNTVFLVLGLFVPRITLLIFWLFVGLPQNSVPFIGDLLLAIFFPRVLIIIYIVENLGVSTPWFWIHLVVALILYFWAGKKVKKATR